MRLLLQRVTQANVSVDGKTVGAIGQGVVVFLGIHKEDTPEKTVWLVNKLLNLRVFESEQGRMDKSLLETGHGLLVVSQFTLYGSCINGRRPDFTSAMQGNSAQLIYDKFVIEAKAQLPNVQTGEFGAEMQVSLTNDGPVTFLIEGK